MASKTLTLLRKRIAMTHPKPVAMELILQLLTEQQARIEELEARTTPHALAGYD